MLKHSLRLCQAASPISKAEFLDAFARVFPEHGQHDGPQKLGIAVSGGVDSMALAAMCRNYLPADEVNLHAFVVDHGLRATSTTEALETQRTLDSKLAMRASVLRLSRASQTRQGIETWARQARFEALVKRCTTEGILTVLFAHHEDDQYENVLIRLSKHGRFTLGMSAVARLPFSLGHIGSYPHFASAWSRPANDTIECFGVRGVVSMQMRIRRPLLGFPKQRLIATCKAFDIPWIEDESNQDCTLTERNAVRDILAKYRLPSALSKESLLHMNQTLEQRSLQLRNVANQLFKLTSVELDLRTASATIAVPKLQDIEQKIGVLVDASSRLSTASLPRAVGMYLECICQLIKSSPGYSIPDNVALLFDDQAKRKRFTLSQVLFHPLPDGRWHISPRSLRSSRFEHRVLKWAQRFRYAKTADKYSAFTFRTLDDHYWVNVSNPSPTQEIVVTYLKPSHLRALEARLATGDVILKDVSDPFDSPRDLSLILKSLGQHSLRWWLPVILVRSQAEQSLQDSLPIHERLQRIAFAQDTDERVVAFPTLNLRVHPKRKGAAPWWIQSLSWEVWYKHIDWMDGRFEKSILLPTSMEARGLKEVKRWKTN